jgi:hypothetical protein
MFLDSSHRVLQLYLLPARRSNARLKSYLRNSSKNRYISVRLAPSETLVITWSIDLDKINNFCNRFKSDPSSRLRDICVGTLSRLTEPGPRSADRGSPPAPALGARARGPVLCLSPETPSEIQIFGLCYWYMYFSRLFELVFYLLPYSSPIFKFSLLFIGNFSSFRPLKTFFFTRRYLSPIKSYQDDR